MGYIKGTLAGGRLRKTYTHNDIEILKFLLTQGIKANISSLNGMHCSHQAI